MQQRSFSSHEALGRRAPIFGGFERMLEACRYYARDKYVNIDETILHNCGLPVVLNITLQEDTLILADEDYMPGKPNHKELAHIAGLIWNTCGNTVIQHIDINQRGAYMLSNRICFQIIKGRILT